VRDRPRRQVSHASVVRIDGATGKRERVLELGKTRLFELHDAGFLTLDAGSIWLTIPVLGDGGADQTLWRVDPRTAG
jgi:hypothetical protein